MNATKPNPIYVSLITIIMVCVALTLSPAARAARSCIFGETISSIQKTSRFVVTPVGRTFKLSRETNPVVPLLWVTVTQIKDLKTGRLYQMNTTENDYYDGGNTVGWIEDITNAADGLSGDNPKQLKGAGAVVAQIRDSEIYCASSAIQ